MITVFHTVRQAESTRHILLYGLMRPSRITSNGVHHSCVQVIDRILCSPIEKTRSKHRLYLMWCTYGSGVLCFVVVISIIIKNTRDVFAQVLQGCMTDTVYDWPSMYEISAWVISAVTIYTVKTWFYPDSIAKYGLYYYLLYSKIWNTMCRRTRYITYKHHRNHAEVLAKLNSAD